MKTTSIMVQNLCVPCFCRCKYCLLSWDGNTVGIDWDKGITLAKKFKKELLDNNLDINFSYTFGYSMEHPKLFEVIRFLKEIGSPQAEFLQCDGLKSRTFEECISFCEMLKQEGIKNLNFTFYGIDQYHDSFACRIGDYNFLLKLLNVSSSLGIHTSASIPLTKENIATVENLVDILKSNGCQKITLFVPHEEGRGKNISHIRIETNDLLLLSNDTSNLLNKEIYKPEKEWISHECYKEETKRALILSLKKDNIEQLEKTNIKTIIKQLEELDEIYYSSFPTFFELASKYGDKTGNKLYRQRDLFYHYRQLFAKEYKINVYDVTDERNSGSRRY